MSQLRNEEPWRGVLVGSFRCNTMEMAAVAMLVAMLVGSGALAHRSAREKRGQGMGPFADAFALQGVSFGISAYTTPGTEERHHVCPKHSAASVLLP